MYYKESYFNSSKIKKPITSMTNGKKVGAGVSILIIFALVGIKHIDWFFGLKKNIKKKKRFKSRS